MADIDQVGFDTTFNVFCRLSTGDDAHDILEGCGTRVVPAMERK
ncbi:MULTISPECIES: hypothetical protein [unclassified Nocardia]|nr:MULTISPECIES: hypothetical protein [unclassified Nocardia]